MLRFVRWITLNSQTSWVRRYKSTCNSSLLCIEPASFPKSETSTHLQISLQDTISNLITVATRVVRGDKARGFSYSSPSCQVDEVPAGLEELAQEQVTLLPAQTVLGYRAGLKSMICAAAEKWCPKPEFESFWQREVKECRIIFTRVHNE